LAQIRSAVPEILDSQTKKNKRKQKIKLEQRCFPNINRTQAVEIDLEVDRYGHIGTIGWYDNRTIN